MTKQGSITFQRGEKTLRLSVQEWREDRGAWEPQAVFALPSDLIAACQQIPALKAQVLAELPPSAEDLGRRMFHMANPVEPIDGCTQEEADQSAWEVLLGPKRHGWWTEQGEIARKALGVSE